MDKAVSAGEMILLCRLCVSPKNKQRPTPEGQPNGPAKKGRVKEGGRGGGVDCASDGPSATSSPLPSKRVRPFLTLSGLGYL